MGREIIFIEPEIKVTWGAQGFEDSDYGVEEITYGAARTAYSKIQATPHEIYEDELRFLKPSDRAERFRKLFLSCAKGGHTSVFYAASHGVEAKLSRLDTLGLCGDPYTKFLQTSLRYTRVGAKDRPGEYIIPNELKRTKFEPLLAKLYQRGFDLYTDMTNPEQNKSHQRIPNEDARFVLNLGVAAKSIHEHGNFASFTAQKAAFDTDDLLIPSTLKSLVQNMFELLQDRYPSLYDSGVVDAFVSNNKFPGIRHPFIDPNDEINQILESSDGKEPQFLSIPLSKELINNARSKHLAKKALLSMSNNGGPFEGYVLTVSSACNNQLIRHDTAPQILGSLYSAAERGSIVIPPKIQNSSYLQRVIDFCNGCHELYTQMVKEDVSLSSAAVALPIALEMKTWVALNGFNTVEGLLGERLHPSAQWEIREKFRSVAKDLIERSPELAGILKELMNQQN